MKKWLCLGLATGLFSGYSPKAPGTVTSALTVLAWYFLAPHQLHLQLIAIIAVALFGWWISHLAEGILGSKDPQVVTIDEVSGQMITLFAVPQSWPFVLAGFVLFRVFDIWKPGPIRWAGNRKGGFGVMADDWLAGLVASGLLQLGMIWL